MSENETKSGDTSGGVRVDAQVGPGTIKDLTGQVEAIREHMQTVIRQRDYLSKRLAALGEDNNSAVEPVDRFTGKRVDRRMTNWSKGNGRRCERCGTECIDRCLQCGAPQCCPKCCDDTEREFMAGIRN